MAQYLSFVALSAVLVIVPGPAVVLIMQQAVAHGVRPALKVASGVFVADLVWAGAAVLGVTAVLVASEPAFSTLRLVGAAYLIYLGFSLLLARRGTVDLRGEPGDEESQGAPNTRGRRASAFRRGFLCDMTNPKTVLVFTSVVPQFVPSDAWVGLPAALGLTFAALGFLSLTLYAVTLGRARRVVYRPRVRTWLARASGGLLVSFGVGLAAESR